MDGTFLSSALTKVPDGAWFTLMLAFILASVFLVWRFGKEQQWFAEAEDRFPTSHFVRHYPDNSLRLTERFDGDTLSHIKGFGIFFDKAGETTPIVFSQFITKLTAVPEVMVFLHLRPLERPSVSYEERHSVSRLAIPNTYRLVVRYGYNDEVVTPDLASVVYEQIRLHKLSGKDKITANGKESRAPDTAVIPDTVMEKLENELVDAELARIESAFAHRVMYIMGKEQMKIKATRNYFHKFLLHIFLWIRENTRAKMASLNIPTDKVIEVGFLKDI